MRLGVAATAICLSIVGVALADPAKAAIRKPTNIPAQPLGSALEELAKERDIQVIYRSEVVFDRRTEGAVGEFTPAIMFPLSPAAPSVRSKPLRWPSP